MLIKTMQAKDATGKLKWSSKYLVAIFFQAKHDLWTQSGFKNEL